MIEKIKFKNYKLFKSLQELEIKPITILIGKNSSGKSAITKLFTLLEGSLKGDFSSPISLVNGDVELGSEFKDLVYGRYDVGVLELGLEVNGITLDVQIASGIRVGDTPKIVFWNLNSEIELKYDNSTGKYINLKTGKKHECVFEGFNLVSSSPEISEEFSIKNKGFFLKTNYIGPYRFVPLDRTIKYSLGRKKDKRLGIDGRDAYPFLVEDALHNNSKILNKVDAWYKCHFDDWGLEIDVNNSPNFELELVKNYPELKINFNDVGQGMIQVLPLVLSSYIVDDSPNLIDVFEQPELHLHPAAHGDLAERFVDSVIDTNKSYVIETHSQNFVLRLRRLVADKTLDMNKLAIYYVDYDNEEGESILKRINVDKNGDVDFWPSNIFNESLDEVLAIRKAQKQNS